MRGGRAKQPASRMTESVFSCPPFPPPPLTHQPLRPSHSAVLRVGYVWYCCCCVLPAGWPAASARTPACPDILLFLFPLFVCIFFFPVPQCSFLNCLVFILSSLFPSRSRFFCLVLFPFSGRPYSCWTFWSRTSRISSTWRSGFEYH